MGALTGKIAWVTGAASGIGAACVKLLAQEGASVIATDIDDSAGGALVATLAGQGLDAVYLHQDVIVEDRWRDLVAEVDRRFGRLDILVANAGIGIGAASIVDMSLADWRRQTAVNLDAVFLSVKYCLPLMCKGAGGSIILMSSVAGLRGSSYLAGYSATKGAVRLFAKSIAMECAQAGNGIRVNSVHPGFIDTPVWGKITNRGQGGGESIVTAQDAARDAVPMGRAGQPEEVAAGVLFLASDASSYITGSELVIDGGIMTGGGVKPPA